MAAMARHHLQRRLAQAQEACVAGGVALPAAVRETQERLARIDAADPPLPLDHLAERELEPDYVDITPELEAAIKGYRLAGKTQSQIADALKVPLPSVQAYLIRARAAGDLNDVEHLLEHHAKPLAAEKLIEGIAAGNQEYVLETLKGRGGFRQHTKHDGAGGQTNLVKFEFVLPEGVQAPAIAVGAVSGKARALTDGEDERA